MLASRGDRNAIRVHGQLQGVLRNAATPEADHFPCRREQYRKELIPEVALYAIPSTVLVFAGIHASGRSRTGQFWRHRFCVGRRQVLFSSRSTFDATGSQRECPSVWRRSQSIPSLTGTAHHACRVTFSIPTVDSPSFCFTRSRLSIKLQA